jgi:anti-sigma factor RsiW
MTCHDTTMSLGVYLLGALDPAERAAVEAHLDDCSVCREELDQLAALPSMLDLLSIDDFPLEPLPAPDELFERVAARAREEHDRTTIGRYRRLTAVAAAFVLIVAVGFGSFALVHRGGHKAPVSASHQVFANQQGHVMMRVALASQASGTGLRVTVSGLPPDEHCWLVAIAKDGTRDEAGRWDATYPGTAQETGSTRIPMSELSQLVLLGTNGKHLVTVNV